MLTRIEIDGFKSFERFTLDVGPMAAFVGPNAVGKSNLFDALRFLRAIGTMPLTRAVQEQRRGLPHELFSFQADGEPRRDMSFAAELLISPDVADAFGSVKITRRRLRYEVRLEWREHHGTSALVVTDESVRALTKKEDRWRPSGVTPHRDFLAAHSGAKDFLLTEVTPGEDQAVVRSFRAKQDGHQGRDRVFDGSRASETVLSNQTTSQFPHLFAVHQELASWRFLQLDPVAMSRPSPQFTSSALDPDGANLAAVLHYLKTSTATDVNPGGVLTDIAASLRPLVHGVRAIHVEPDPTERTFRIEVEQADGARISARLLSAGTLRLIALFAVLFDDRFNGLLMMEEPENGIHPERLRGLLRTLRNACADPNAAAGETSAKQLLVNSHSPVVLAVLRDRDQEVFFVDMVSRRVGSANNPVRRTRIRPVWTKAQQPLSPPPEIATIAEVEKYLNSVTGDT